MRWLGRGGFGPGKVSLFRSGSAGVGAVWALCVVDGAEGVELVLEFGQGGGSGSWGQPAFEGLVESFDLALGLGVVGMTVFLGDAQAGQ